LRIRLADFDFDANFDWPLDNTSFGTNKGFL
jgi:hypothetical protein